MNIVAKSLRNLTTVISMRSDVKMNTNIIRSLFGLASKAPKTKSAVSENLTKNFTLEKNINVPKFDFSSYQRGVPAPLKIFRNARIKMIKN